MISIQNVMIVSVEKKDWEFEGRNGTVYKINIVDEKGTIQKLKTNKQVFEKLEKQQMPVLEADLQGELVSGRVGFSNLVVTE